MESNISRDLKKWREKADLTQEELAEAVGVRRETVVHWENINKPEKWPKKQNCLRLSYILKVNVTPKGIIENNIDMKIEKEDHMNGSPSKDDKDWYKETIQILIHQNGNSVEKLTETADKLHVRDLAQIEDLKNEKSLLWQEKAKIWEHIDSLIVHLKPPQKTQ